jgi:hypothetical protein
MLMTCLIPVPRENEMKCERVLKLKLDEAIDYFSGRKWKLFAPLHIDEGRLLKLEVPISQSESFVVELVFDEGEFLNEAVRALKAAGWIEQETRTVP